MTALLVADSIGRGGGFFLVGILVPLLIVGLVAYGIFELVRARGGFGSAAPAGAAAAGSARAVLDERFARGEIDAEDYVQRRTLLDGSPAPAGPPPAPEYVAPQADAPTAEQAVPTVEDPSPPTPSA